MKETGKGLERNQMACSRPSCLEKTCRRLKLQPGRRVLIDVSVHVAEFSNMVSRIAFKTQKNLEGLQLDTSSWGEQFYAAMNVNGGEVDSATRTDYALHFVTFFWKVRRVGIGVGGGGWGGGARLISQSVGICQSGNVSFSHLVNISRLLVSQSVSQ